MIQEYSDRVVNSCRYERKARKLAPFLKRDKNEKKTFSR